MVGTCFVHADQKISSLNIALRSYLWVEYGSMWPVGDMGKSMKTLISRLTHRVQLDYRAEVHDIPRRGSS